MTRAAVQPGPGRPKDMRKRASILDAAKSLFSERGYSGTSMDAVAQEAAVSKLTVYSHFGGKDKLFRAAVRARCADLFPETLYMADEKTDFEQALRIIARHHARLATSEEATGMWRAIASACSERTPQLGRLLWEEGPLRTHALLRDFLARVVAQGRLDIDDCDLAATQFMALLKGDLHFKRMLGCADGECDDFARHVDANAEAAVTMFLRAYAVREPAAERRRPVVAG